MYFGSIEMPKVEIPACSPAEHEALLFVVPDPVEQSDAFDLVCGLVLLADAAFKDGRFVKLPVVASDLFLQVVIAERLRIGVPADASCIYSMCFDKLMSYPRVFGDIPKGHGHHSGVQILQPVVKGPAHDAHKGRVTKALASFDCCRECDLPGVVLFVAVFA